MKSNGRPELVYGMKCRDDEIEHEVLITEAELSIGGPFVRNAPAGRTTADAMTIRNGIRFYIEVDNDSMSAKQMREKWVRYEGVRGFILVLCRTRSRLRRLIEGAWPVKGVVLFARFDWLRRRNVKKRWIDIKGKRINLESWSSES